MFRTKDSTKVRLNRRIKYEPALNYNMDRDKLLFYKSIPFRTLSICRSEIAGYLFLFFPNRPVGRKRNSFLST